MNVIRMLLLTALPLVTVVASGHHSPAVLYHVDQDVTVEGVVTGFNPGNPHLRVFLTIAEPDGSENEWMAEGGSRVVLMRNGWSEDQVSPGDRVTIRGNPSRDVSRRIIHMLQITLPDGSTLFAEDVPDNSYLEEMRRRRR